MTRIGATGHQELPAEALTELTEGVRAVMKGCAQPLEAVSALAAGADQLIAREALRCGATLRAIVPSEGYEVTFSPNDRSAYEWLLEKADDVTRLDFPSPTEEAFWAAGKAVVDQCDVLIAVWDGEPARGLGGTGDVVTYARELGRDVRIIWPAAAVRG
jgi:hypothetical protein